MPQQSAMKFDPNASVTKYIRTDIPKLKTGRTVEESLAELRSQNLGEKVVYFYVLDDEDRLVGVIPTRRLLMSPLDRPVASIMVPITVTIPEDANLVQAARAILQHRFLALPVVDKERRLLGILDATLFSGRSPETETRDVTPDEVFQMIGVHISRMGSLWANFGERFPWLLSNIAGGLACAFIAGRYERFLDAVIVLALFIPIVLALAESVSMQSMTLTVQSLGTRIAAPDWKEIIVNVTNEFKVAILLGAASGLTVGSIALLWKGDGMVAFVIGASIALAMITACILGVLLPTLVSLTGRNPRIASGPVVLATADIATMLFYFTIGSAMLG